ncbi:MAG TPA: hypothetical protein DEQ40_06765 [Oxalobacteraceae bacterium]|jgi:uncharacterized membrane protein YdjX (TVP38/TMEM64 family)|nr:hypothetical protein [Oxalobacteraceae bacterium]
MKKFLAVALVVAIGTAAVLFRGTTLAADFAALMERSIALCREAGPFAFFGAMALLPIVGFPLAPFTVAAGPAFGPTMGVPAVVLCAVAAVTINVALSYWIAARLLRPVALRLVAWLGYRLPAMEGQSAWLATLLIRIVPGPPFFLQSYLLGLAQVPFSIYICVSTLVPLGYITSIIVFGDALMQGNRTAAIAAVVLMLLIGAVIHQLRRRLTKPAAVASVQEGEIEGEIESESWSEKTM